MPIRLRIILVTFFVAGLFFLLSSLADGAWHRTQVTTTASESTAPRIVHDSLDDLHIFWEEEGEIRHQVFGTPSVETLGSGHSLDVSVCPVCGDISVAWIGSNARAQFRSWEGGTWGEVSTMPFLYGATRRVAVSHHGDGRLLWGEYDEVLEEFVVLFASQDDGAWSWPLELDRFPAMDYLLQTVALGLRRTGTDGQLLASWMLPEFSSSMGLMVRSGQGVDWGPVEQVNDWLAGRYSVDSHYPSGMTHFVSNGPQPTCPCNVLVHISGTEGNWSESEYIGRDHYPAEMEWPQEMSVHVRHLGDVPYVAWRHESYELLELVDERLILGRKEAGIWSYDYDIAVGRDAHQPDVSTSASGDVYVVWSDESDGFVNLHLATTEFLASVPTTDAYRGSALSVYPNPTQNGSFLEWNRADLENPVLRVFDASGRELTSLRLSGPSGSAGPFASDAEYARVWWEASDAAGRPLPTGTYLLELSDDVRREESKRLIVIR